MIKVLMIASGLHRNGTETFMMNVFKNIDRSKIMFDFLLYEPDENGYEQEARELGANIYFYQPRNKNYFKYKNSLKQFFRQHAKEYRAVHYNGNSFTDVYPIRLAKKHGIPVRVVHSHNTATFGFHNILLHKLHRHNIHNIATHYFACSESAKEWGFRGSKGYDSSLVIPNGIDLDFFNYNPIHRDQIRKELEIPENAFVMCHTGNFRPVKNHPFIIEVFDEIKRREPNSVLILTGAGGNIEEIKTLVAEKGFTDSVKFIGIRKDVNKLISASDAYLFPSFYEGLPFALIEAQTSGIPVFASDTISKEIKLTDNLFFLPLELSAKEWADRIMEYDYSNRSSAPRTLLGKYDIKESVKLISSIYISKP